MEEMRRRNLLFESVPMFEHPQAAQLEEGSRGAQPRRYFSQYILQTNEAVPICFSSPFVSSALLCGP